MTPPLPERLKAATRALHVEVERAPLMQALLRGRLPQAGYAALLRNLHALYAALEAGLARHAADPALGGLQAPALRRAPAIEADLAELHGPGWRTEIPLQPAALAYASRLDALADAEPALLAAHGYVRYLGDLNGGRVLRQVVARHYALQGGAGTAFYDFGNAEPAALIAPIRDGLARLGEAEPAAADAIVAEALSAFERHRDLFAELAPAA